MERGEWAEGDPAGAFHRRKERLHLGGGPFPLEVEKPSKKGEEGGEDAAQEPLKLLHVRSELEETLAEMDQFAVKFQLALAPHRVAVRGETVERILAIKQPMAGLKLELLKGKEIARAPKGVPCLEERRDDSQAGPAREVGDRPPELVEAEMVQDNQEVDVRAAGNEVGGRAAPVQAHRAEVVTVESTDVGQNRIERGISLRGG